MASATSWGATAPSLLYYYTTKLLLYHKCTAHILLHHYGKPLPSQALNGERYLPGGDGAEPPPAGDADSRLEVAPNYHITLYYKILRYYYTTLYYTRPQQHGSMLLSIRRCDGSRIVAAHAQVSSGQGARGVLFGAAAGGPLCSAVHCNEVQ